MGLYVASSLRTDAGEPLRCLRRGYFEEGQRRELKIRYGKWEKEDRFHSPPSWFPFAAFYLPDQRGARAYEDDLIRYYCPPWNTKFHR